MYLYTEEEHPWSQPMGGGEAPLTQCNCDEVTLERGGGPDDTDLPRSQHVNFWYRKRDLSVDL